MNMKAFWNNIFYLVLIGGICLWVLSCQREILPEPDAPAGQFNQFSVGGYDYSVDMALTRAGEESYYMKEENCYFSLHATPRSISTKSSFNDVDWDTHDSKVGIYLVEHIDEAAFNETQFDEDKVKVVAASANLERHGNIITSSSVDLLEQVKHYVSGNAFEGKTVDACAYFPYAEEITQTVALSNTLNSVVGIFNHASKANVLHLPFTMKPTQTDDNIWFHDLMVSVREDANENNTFGNIGKKNRSTYNGSAITGYYDLDDNFRTDRGSEITCDNIHMRMKHLFSRFTIKILFDNRFMGSRIDRVYVDGTKVYSFGELNLLTGKVAPGGASRIDRLVSKDIIDGNIEFDMMLCPCHLTGPGEMVFHIIIDGSEYKCDLFKMMHEKDILSSYIYDLNLMFSEYSTLIVNNGYGGTVTCVQHNPGEFNKHGSYGERWVISMEQSDMPREKIGEMAQWLVAAPGPGWKFDGIYVNGERIDLNEDTAPLEHAFDGYRVRENVGTADGLTTNHYYCKLEDVNDKDTRYDVVYVPDKSRWYAQPNHIIQQFDGIYNNGFTATVEEVGGVPVQFTPETNHTVATWKDLSGRGHDAQLRNIDTHDQLQPWRREKYDQTDLSAMNGTVMTKVASYTEYQTTMQSGWVEGGLKLDGINDYVTFPAVLPERDNDPETQDLNITIEMYVCMERPQAARFPRILCEAEPGIMPSNAGVETFTTHGYPSLLFRSSSNKKGEPNAGNVLLYPTPIGYNGSTSQIYFMGCGHNDGNHTSDTTPRDYSLACPPDGDKIMHLVFWYRGGYGNVTDMSIFKGGHTRNDLNKIGADLGGGDPRNSLITMVEYWDRSVNDIVRKTLTFHGNDAEYQALLDTVFGPGTVLNGRYDHERVTTRPLDKTIVAQNNDAHIEDPFVPSERWACIGGRPNDYTRQFNGTIFSFIVYDTLLPISDIDHNRDLHFQRFGAYKTNVPERGGGLVLTSSNSISY